jgi:hypothetical protein
VCESSIERNTTASPRWHLIRATIYLTTHNPFWAAVPAATACANHLCFARFRLAISRSISFCGTANMRRAASPILENAASASSTAKLVGLSLRLRFFIRAFQFGRPSLSALLPSLAIPGAPSDAPMSALYVSRLPCSPLAASVNRCPSCSLRLLNRNASLSTYASR